ncbi:hypothetical protein ACHAXN_001070 [Cyclotella atomus]|jgi:hypothetical protein
MQLQSEIKAKLECQRGYANDPLIGTDHFLYKDSVKRMKEANEELNQLRGIVRSDLRGDFDQE